MAPTTVPRVAEPEDDGDEQSESEPILSLQASESWDAGSENWERDESFVLRS
jgi:hypothetical protein